jgi:multisubunit Na+/H+ antiporter MnhG subunit
MHIPIDESQYVISLEEILWGGTLVAITMAMHGLGMLGILRVSNGLKHRFEPKPSLTTGLLILILASWMIMLLHLTEVVVWAAFFLWKGAFPNHSVAYYFSLNEYTTVGSNYNLPLRWRLLEGTIATAGLLTFAWSTGILLTLAQDFQDTQMRLLKQKREKRQAPHAPAPPPPAAPPR